MTEEKDFYSEQDVKSAIEGMSWNVQQLINAGKIRPDPDSGEIRLTPFQFKSFLMWRDYSRNLGIKISEGHARRRQGIPPKSGQPREYTPVKGVVYIVECAGRYKIGKTQDLTFRLAHFTIILPFEPILIHQISSGNISQTERDLHIKYKEKRVRGEWFDLSQEDIEAIKRL